MAGGDLREPGERVSPRARLMWGLAALAQGVLTLVLVVLVGPALGAYEPHWWVVLPAVAVVAAYVLGMPQWRYLVHRWEVTGSAVYTQTGWWTRERRIAPMSRIQTVDYAQGALARLLGLASVTVTTASAAGALEISGLDAERALRLVDELTLRADARPGDAT